MRSLPPLSALKAFEAIARTGSVTAAAQELHRTHGAVSRQLRMLQEHAGVALFDRQGNGLRLNEHGAALQGLVRPLFDQLEAGYAGIVQHARHPGVHVACSATFAMRCLVPRLGDFYRQHPDIRIRLSMTSARELRGEGADLLIAWDLAAYAQADQASAIWLAPVEFGPVRAPDYPAAGAGRMRIGHDFMASGWTQWRHLTGIDLKLRREITFPHTHLCIEAAVSGLGVALVEQRLVRKELEEGVLVAPHGFTAFPGGLMALPAAHRKVGPQALAFTEWLRNALRVA
ncbi:LysR substrate-binding domain-containing protein [Bordetella petrii]|uniref:LysR substrate-binding domain-containing protein n=1 Tax=Bordetella petrii TaxID=94624 RepID=UPI001E4B888C|nr:LysR substrate-binding domain-containing protein [Bordetella petrii]MCD0504164.1 LysR substrate-binding domain-containing protein [Bordetella petrii]